MLLNLAIESTIDSTFKSAEMEIDYIRIFAPDAGPGDPPIWSDEFN